MADFRKWFLLIILLTVISLPANAQLFGSVTDAPQHGFVVGFGVGPTSQDFSGLFGYAEKIPSTAATYSYSGVSLIPAFKTNTAGAKVLVVTPVLTTGIKQVLWQSGRFTVAVDGGAGASAPSTGVNAFNFAADAAIDFVLRLNKVANTVPGSANNYFAIQPTFTQLTGVTGGTVVSIGVAWVHGIN